MGVVFSKFRINLDPLLEMIWQSYFNASLAIFTVTVTVHDYMAASMNWEKPFDSLIEGYIRCMI